MKKPLMIVGMMLAAGMMAQADKIALPKESPAGTVVVQSPKAHDTRKAGETIAKYLAIGAAGGLLPASFQVRAETDGVTRPVTVFEGWSFTPTEASALARVREGTNWQFKAVAIAKVTDCKAVCEALQAGGVVELATVDRVAGRGNRVGPFWKGTPYIGGGREIVVSVEGQTLRAEEDCVGRPMSRADSDRFCDLYETLRKLAPSPAAAIKDAIATGATGGAVPASLEVLIETFGSKEKGGEGLDSIVSEAWRFTPTAVDTFNCNVVDKTRKIAGLKEVCAALQAAGFADLADAKRGEDYAGKLVLDGTSCSYGWRYVRVTVDGQSQTVGEGTTWPAFTDAKQIQRMRELYEVLRKIALTNN